MSKLWLKHQKFLKGNAGFSLVELIIVIAIMAALVAILAPQYIKYVEKSRVQADETCASEILGACKVAASDPAVSLTKSTTYTFAWNGAATLTTNAATDGNANLKSAVTDALGSLPTIKSSAHSGGTYTVSIIVDASGTATVSGTW